MSSRWDCREARWKPLWKRPGGSCPGYRGSIQSRFRLALATLDRYHFPTSRHERIIFWHWKWRHLGEYNASQLSDAWTAPHCSFTIISDHQQPITHPTTSKSLSSWDSNLWHLSFKKTLLTIRPLRVRFSPMTRFKIVTFEHHFYFCFSLQARRCRSTFETRH